MPNRHHLTRLVVASVVVMGLNTSAFAAVIRVPADEPTIQDAVRNSVFSSNSASRGGAIEAARDVQLRIDVELETLEDGTEMSRDRATFITTDDASEAVDELKVLGHAEAEDHPLTMGGGVR